MCWSCSHPERVPCQGSRECHWVTPSPWCLTLGTGCAVCRGAAQGALLEAPAGFSPRLQGAVTFPELQGHLGPAALCWLGLWAGAVLGHGLLGSMVPPEPPWVLARSSVLGQNQLVWGHSVPHRRLPCRALAGQTPGFSWLFRDRTRLPFLLSHTIFPKEPCDVGCQC